MNILSFIDLKLSTNLINDTYLIILKELIWEISQEKRRGL